MIQGTTKTPGMPNGQRRDLGRRLVLGTALATSAFLGGYRGYVRRAYAACDGNSSIGFFCYGATTTTQLLNGTPLVVSTESGFSIDTTGSGGNAFMLYGTGGLRFVDNRLTTITGARTGISAANFGGGLTISTFGTVTGIDGDGITASNAADGAYLTIRAVDVSGGRTGISAVAAAGSLSITATGTVTGTNYDGIAATNYGTDLTIEAADVSGGRNGIDARNYGSGVLKITTTGAVEGMTGAGILAHNRYGTDLTVAVADVNGGYRGIHALNEGSGSLSITATGAVIGTRGDGIYALNDGTGTNLTIEAADVSGGTYGIRALNTGSGALSITATGAVTGTDSDGIYAVAGFNTTGLTIEAADVNGGTSGIDARNFGTGALSITATGMATGRNDDGISAFNSTYGTGLTIEAADASGANRGIYARNYGSGALAITATGPVTSTNNDAMVALNDGTDLTIVAAGVSGERFGIVADSLGSGALSITAAGMVTGGTGTGISAGNGTYGTDLTINAADVSGGIYGIYAGNDGSGALTITTTGVVKGSGTDGIVASSGGTDLTISVADVSGMGYGIRAFNTGSGALSIAATGTVTGGAGDGIYALNGSYAGGTGTDLKIAAVAVSGGDNGILASNFGNGALEITATGPVTGTNGAGILAANDTGSNATDLTITAADVSGGTDGIFAGNDGSGALSITTSGTVDGGSGKGIYAINNGTDLTIEATNVSGGINGIVAHNDGTGALSITTAGTVTGTSYDGIFARNDGRGVLTITATDVSSGDRGIFASNFGDSILSITATGTVTGTTYDGISAVNNSGTDLTIAAADVSGGFRGITARNGGSGTLSVTASGTVTGKDGDGIFARNSGTDLTIEAADVGGGTNGIYARSNGSGTLSITATGMVSGEHSDGIYARSNNGTDLTIDAADVSGGRWGIAALNYGTGAVSVTATGTVTGTSDNGILVVNNSAITDSTTTVTVKASSAVSGAAAAVGLVSTSGVAASLTNAGSISGTTGVIVVGNPATISNAGTITGTAGPAIDLTGSVGTNTINQQGGTITGAILLSAGSDTVNVTGGAIAGNVVGQGSAVTNFALGDGTFSFAAPFAVTGMADVAMNSGTVAIAGTIDTDALTVNGGTMTVAGAVNTPVFNLNGGVLSVSSDANLGSEAGALNFDGGTLQNTAAFATARVVTLNAGGGTFRTDADLTVASGLTGVGGLTKTGTAALTLNGVNSFTGLTTVNAGKLVVGDDSHATASLASAVLVNRGGTLGGIGTIGSGAGSAVTIASGGTIAPGNSSGTLTVDGDITFETHSTYEAEINPALESDLIAASGAATINGGTVYALKAGGVYTPDSRWTILGADGGVTGTFDTLDQNMPFVDLALAYDANNVYIDATRNDVAFCDVAGTFNQCSTGDGLESTGGGNPVYDAVAALPDEETARYALDQLSGEIYASTRSALIQDSHFVRDAVNDRIRSAFGDVTGTDMPLLAYGPDGARPAAADSVGPVAWGYAFGSWGSFDGDGNAAGMDTSTGGFLTGIDGEVASNVRLGLLAGYSHSSFEVDDRASSGDSDNYHFGLYAGGKWDAFRLTGGLAYTWHDIETNRSVAFPGFSDSLTGDYNAGTFQVFGEAGYKIEAGTVSFEPFANLAYVNLHTDGFTEDGGAAALHVRGETTDTTFTTLGVHLSSAFTFGGMKAKAHGTLGWRHAFGDTTPISTHAFTGGDVFDIAGVPIAKDAALIEAGFDLDLTDTATLGIAYQGQFGSGTTQNGFKANLAVRF